MGKGAGGSQKAKILKEKHEAKLEFLEGYIGLRTQKPSMRGKGIFFGTMHSCNKCS